MFTTDSKAKKLFPFSVSILYPYFFRFKGKNLCFKSDISALLKPVPDSYTKNILKEKLGISV